jgi:hypothetical protein
VIDKLVLILNSHFNAATYESAISKLCCVDSDQQYDPYNLQVGENESEQQKICHILLQWLSKNVWLKGCRFMVLKGFEAPQLKHYRQC